MAAPPRGVRQARGCGVIETGRGRLAAGAVGGVHGDAVVRQAGSLGRRTVVPTIHQLYFSEPTQ